MSVESTHQTFSLAGAALLWSGLSNDLSQLHQSTLVVKPSKPFDGTIEPVA